MGHLVAGLLVGAGAGAFLASEAMLIGGVGMLAGAVTSSQLPRQAPASGRQPLQAGASAPGRAVGSDQLVALTRAHSWAPGGLGERTSGDWSGA